MKPTDGTEASTPPPAADRAQKSNFLDDALVRLTRACDDGTAQQLLRGKHLALIGHRPGDAATREVVRAATGLGAHVSLLSALELLDPAAERADAAVRLLGRLYDAIDCGPIDPPAMVWLEREAGLPVLSLTVAGSRWGRAVEDAQMPGEAQARLDGKPNERHQRALQAALLHVIIK